MIDVSNLERSITVATMFTLSIYQPGYWPEPSEVNLNRSWAEAFLYAVRSKTRCVHA
jgi:hypothetical protein